MLSRCIAENTLGQESMLKKLGVQDLKNRSRLIEKEIPKLILNLILRCVNYNNIESFYPVVLSSGLD